jgi:hypothetical protein
MDIEKIELVSRKAALFHLNQFGIVNESTEDTKKLIQRQIDGDNPSEIEWSLNGRAIAIAKNKAKNISSSSSIYMTIALNVVYGNEYGNNHNNAYANNYEKNRITARYIVDILADDLDTFNGIDKKVLCVIHENCNNLDMSSYHKNGYCGTTHCRAGWEIVLHPQGQILEKYLGSWMAATVIHYKSTGNFVDYFDTSENVMKELTSN